MNEREILELIEESIDKLKLYNSKKDAYISDLKHREDNIQTGRRIKASICRGPLFEDEDGRDPDYGSIIGDEPFDALNKELKLTSLIIQLLKGDISQAVFDKKTAEI
jgi:hypothetical protein